MDSRAMAICVELPRVHRQRFIKAYARLNGLEAAAIERAVERRIVQTKPSIDPASDAPSDAARPGTPPAGTTHLEN